MPILMIQILAPLPISYQYPYSPTTCTEPLYGVNVNQSFVWNLIVVCSYLYRFLTVFVYMCLVPIGYATQVTAKYTCTMFSCYCVIIFVYILESGREYSSWCTWYVFIEVEVVCILRLCCSGQRSSQQSGGISDASVKAYKDMNTFLASFIDHVSH